MSEEKRVSLERNAEYDVAVATMKRDRKIRELDNAQRELNLAMSRLKWAKKDSLKHCWESGPRTKDDCGTTCMLRDEHDGPHKWTRDDEIRIEFAALE
jgi:hypothetical protein